MSVASTAGIVLMGIGWVGVLGALATYIRDDWTSERGVITVASVASLVVVFGAVLTMVAP